MQHAVRAGMMGQQALGNSQVAGFVGRLADARQVVQKDHRVRRLDFGPAARDADAFDLVAGLAELAQPGGIDHVQRHAVDLDRLGHLVARGAGNRRDDRQLGAGQRVEQRTLADIRLAGQHHLDAFTQQGALASA